MYEYEHFDGDHYIVCDIVETDDDNGIITLAISNQGRITQDTFDLHEDDYGLYFEYGLYQDKIHIEDFICL